MRNLSAILGTSLLLTACGTNFNQLLVDKEQEEAVDQLVKEAQYEYDKGNFDKALGLTNKALSINPYGENALILNGFVYLSKSGLDGFNLSKTLIKNSESGKTIAGTTPGATQVAKTGDTTTDNFNTFKDVMNLQESDYVLMADEDAISDGTTSTKIYIPKPASAARESGSLTLEYLNDAIRVLCPILDDAANYEEDTDPRHDCQKSPYTLKSRARSNFAWALSHLGEAITFYSVILYDSNGDGIPNIQAAIPTNTSTLNTGQLLSTFVKVNTAVSAIFPTDPAAAADSMLNGLFGNLKTAASALAAIPGVPKDVTKSVNDSISDLDAKVSQIGTASSEGTANVSTQNEAIKNALTTGLSASLGTAIEQKGESLSPADQDKACCVYTSINSTAEKPSTCDKGSTYYAATCPGVLATLEQTQM